MAGDLTVRLGTVVRDGEGQEVGIVWDGTGEDPTDWVCLECGTKLDDLSRLWDGVALWVAMHHWQAALEENRANLIRLGKLHLGIEPG